MWRKLGLERVGGEGHFLHSVAMKKEFTLNIHLAFLYPWLILFQEAGQSHVTGSLGKLLGKGNPTLRINLNSRDNFFFSFLFFFLNWSIIALQYCASFSHKKRWISYVCTYIPFLLSLLPSIPTRPSRLGHHRAPSWAPGPYSSLPLATCFTHSNVYMSVTLSACLTLFFPLTVSPSLLSMSAKRQFLKQYLLVKTDIKL